MSSSRVKVLTKKITIDEVLFNKNIRLDEDFDNSKK
jgi:hypothetical protein